MLYTYTIGKRRNWDLNRQLFKCPYNILFLVMINSSKVNNGSSGISSISLAFLYLVRFFSSNWNWIYWSKPNVFTIHFISFTQILIEFCYSLLFSILFLTNEKRNSVYLFTIFREIKILILLKLF